MSFGLATTHEPGGLGTLLADADAALYRAKATGRDRVIAA
jgi:PleD family two-component response regulator